MTSNLGRHAFEHREGLMPGFTSTYGCKLLVWYKRFNWMDDAIVREKQIKGRSRRKKRELIEALNQGFAP